MKPMSALEQECAEGLAFALAHAMCTSIPSLFGDPPETVVSFTLAVACSLVRAKAKAARRPQ